MPSDCLLLPLIIRVPCLSPSTLQPLPLPLPLPLSIKYILYCLKDALWLLFLSLLIREKLGPLRETVRDAERKKREVITLPIISASMTLSHDLLQFWITYCIYYVPLFFPIYCITSWFWSFYFWFTPITTTRYYVYTIQPNQNSVIK